MSRDRHHLKTFELLTGHFTLHFKLLHKQEDYWRRMMNGTIVWKKQVSTRCQGNFDIFCHNLVQCHPSSPKALCNAFLNVMSEDFQRGLHLPVTREEVVYQTVQAVDQCLRGNNKEIEDFHGLPNLSDFSDLHAKSSESNRLIQTELGYDRTALEELRNQAGHLNDGQNEMFDRVIDAVRDENTDKRLFFLDGPGGTGQSFLLQTGLATVRLDGKIALATASSGIVATQLMGGRTAHYTFQLGLDSSSSSTCNVTARSNRAELLRQASLIVWDEAPLMIKHGFHAVDRTLRDLMKNDKPFGGKVVLLAGDFRQILPVIPHAIVTMEAFTVLHLKTNMRVQRITDEGTAKESFADFLLRVGEGRNEGCTEREKDYSRIPQDMLLSTEDGQDKASARIDHVYDGLGERYLEDGYFADRAILTPLNVDVLNLNGTAIDSIPKETRKYVSVDTVEDAQGSDTSTFPEKFLNSLRISGMPPHKLNLKVGAPIILL
ncbi:Helitron helicase [Phytophthora megakarya]|uniref:ATP-dependent DNA helicase n=1 Tax=Phytophthora megakarya TaxID=4795 RepID=A0A225WHL9_9STRA|nr:Helitron helicase [Phytophthora megakarya]